MIMGKGWKRRNGGPPHRCGARDEARRGLRAWFRTPLGRRVTAADREQLDAVLANLFGFHLLQIGDVMDAELLAGSRIRHRVVMAEGRGDARARLGLFAGADALPVGSESVDVIVLPHVMEVHDRPHQVLREVERSLIPEGHVVIVGFNPWSLWGLWRLLAGRRRVPWCGHFYSPTRIRDWLSLLGFDIVQARSYFFRPPLKGAALGGRMHFMERLGRRWWPLLGGCYILVARKRVVTLTPIRPRWRPRLRRAGAPMGAPFPGSGRWTSRRTGGDES